MNERIDTLTQDAAYAAARREVEEEALDLCWWYAQWDDYRAPPGWMVTALAIDYWWAYTHCNTFELGRHARQVVEAAIERRAREMIDAD